MIIKSLHIISFGGLKNRDIDLSRGVNVIDGANESGKSSADNDNVVVFDFAHGDTSMWFCLILLYRIRRDFARGFAQKVLQ